MEKLDQVLRSAAAIQKADAVCNQLADRFRNNAKKRRRIEARWDRAVAKRDAARQAFQKHIS